MAGCLLGHGSLAAKQQITQPGSDRDGNHDPSVVGHEDEPIPLSFSKFHLSSFHTLVWGPSERTDGRRDGWITKEEGGRAGKLT